jgi:hypothetical protein
MKPVPGSQLSLGLAVIRAVGAIVTAGPGSGAGDDGGRVRSGHVETRSLIVTHPYGADRAGSLNTRVIRVVAGLFRDGLGWC